MMIKIAVAPANRNVYCLFIIIFLSLCLAKVSVAHDFKGNTAKGQFKGVIVFDKAAGGFHIYKIIGSLPHKEIQLTKGWDEDCEEPRWSPDGSYIAYVRKTWKPEVSNIYVMNADGSDNKKITDFDHGIIFNLEWDNEAEIYFTYNPNRVDKDIIKKTVNVKTGVISRFYTENGRIDGCNDLIPSPDQRSLLCLHSGNIILYHKGLTENGVRKLILYLIHTLYTYRVPEETIVYHGTTYKLRKEIYSDAYAHPQWSKDSKLFAVMDRNIYIYNAAGNNIKEINVPDINTLCKNEGAGCMKEWFFEPQMLLYSCHCGADGIAENIYMLDLKSGKSSFISEGYYPDWHEILTNE